MRALALPLLLSGCASQPVVQVVEVPVPVSCVEPGAVPARPVSAFDALPADANIFADVRALLVDREAAKGYQAKLEAVVDGCQQVR